MWLATTSSNSPMPCRRSSPARAAKPSSPPSSGFRRVGSVTSYPWGLPVRAASKGEAYRSVMPRASR